MTLMDTAQLLGNVGEFIGAIFIVVTLIYGIVTLALLSLHYARDEGSTTWRQPAFGWAPY